jgi:hypothetical protein
MKFPYTWIDDQEPPADVLDKIVFPDLARVLESIATAEQLMFHTIFLTDDLEGPIVMAYGKEGDSTIYLHYLTSPAWVKL